MVFFFSNCHTLGDLGPKRRKLHATAETHQRIVNIRSVHLYGNVLPIRKNSGHELAAQ